ncbi:MAG: 4Fe-4S binding protein, partial [Anaerolineae bacterium]
MGREILLRPERCILCYACEVACAREHGGQGNIWVVFADGGGVPLLCRHCERAPCITVCRTGALVREGNEVRLLPERCTGCELCLWACPF